MEWKEIALEELKILEEKITRHANLAFQTRSWLFALITALVVGLLDEKANLNGIRFLLIAFVLTLTFLWMELIQRIPQKQSMVRVSEIEKALRGETDYDGPKISKSLSMGGSFSHYWKVFSPPILIPYFSIIIIITFLAIIFWR